MFRNLNQDNDTILIYTVKLTNVNLLSRLLSKLMQKPVICLKYLHLYWS